MSQASVYPQRQPTAFISCSLRPDDKPFVDRVETIIRCFGFHPVGTVGRYSAAPAPIWQQMRDNIKAADCVVLVATPRYIQQDVSDKRNTGKAMSEMLHTEVGMAVAMDRPVLAFVLEGTDVGHFLPQAVQYITLRQDGGDLFVKWTLIQSYCRGALTLIQERWAREGRSQALKLVVGGLAFFGGMAIWDRLSEDRGEGEAGEDASYDDDRYESEEYED